ncbi:hypothetical protein Bbelb_041650 [Branchiostoma belcheri]|nr:hypothetical protein Bbelb_041650 [Branchiostoma belcheri]
MALTPWGEFSHALARANCSRAGIDTLPSHTAANQTGSGEVVVRKFPRRSAAVASDGQNPPRPGSTGAARIACGRTFSAAQRGDLAARDVPRCAHAGRKVLCRLLGEATAGEMSQTELAMRTETAHHQQKAVNVNVFDPEGQTALHQSVLDGNLELVKLLVKFGADVRLANRDGWSALHIAAYVEIWSKRQEEEGMRRWKKSEEFADLWTAEGPGVGREELPVNTEECNTPVSHARALLSGAGGSLKKTEDLAKLARPRDTSQGLSPLNNRRNYHKEPPVEDFNYISLEIRRGFLLRGKMTTVTEQSHTHTTRRLETEEDHCRARVYHSNGRPASRQFGLPSADESFHRLVTQAWFRLGAKRLDGAIPAKLRGLRTVKNPPPGIPAMECSVRHAKRELCPVQGLPFSRSRPPEASTVHALPKCGETYFSSEFAKERIRIVSFHPTHSQFRHAMASMGSMSPAVTLRALYWHLVWGGGRVRRGEPCVSVTEYTSHGSPPRGSHLPPDPVSRYAGVLSSKLPPDTEGMPATRSTKAHGPSPQDPELAQRSAVTVPLCRASVPAIVPLHGMSFTDINLQLSSDTAGPDQPFRCPRHVRSAIYPPPPATGMKQKQTRSVPVSLDIVCNMAVLVKSQVANTTFSDKKRETEKGQNTRKDRAGDSEKRSAEDPVSKEAPSIG